MGTDSKILENISTVVGLNIVGGAQNTPQWERTYGAPYLDVSFDGVFVEGIDPDRHYGSTRTPRAYQLGAWAGRIVRNERQISIATAEDIVDIAENLNIVDIILEQKETVISFMSKAMAINLVLDGGDQAELLGPGSKLMIGDPEVGAIVDISEAHLPCSKPAAVIAKKLDLDYEKIKTCFKAVAADRRGFMAGVYAPGRIALGDSVDIQLPIDHRHNLPNWS